MWKKSETSERPSKVSGQRAHPSPEMPAHRSRVPRLAIVGRKIRIKGDVTGNEDLLIEGRVEGSVDLRAHSVTVGPQGDVKASIVGRIVTIEGRVQGNLTAEEQIVLLSSADVEGDLAAPRVVLEDGASFRGGVDMGDRAPAGRSGALGRPKAKPVSPPRPQETEAESSDRAGVEAEPDQAHRVTMG